MQFQLQRELRGADHDQGLARSRSRQKSGKVGVDHDHGKKFRSGLDQLFFPNRRIIILVRVVSLLNSCHLVVIVILPWLISIGCLLSLIFRRDHDLASGSRSCQWITILPISYCTEHYPSEFLSKFLPELYLRVPLLIFRRDHDLASGSRSCQWITILPSREVGL